MKVLEKNIQKTILDYLRYRGVFAWKSNTVGIKKPGGSYIPVGMRGVSDIIGVMKGGRFLAIEVKKDKSCKLTVEQNSFLMSINQMGGLAFVAYGLDEVVKIGI